MVCAALSITHCGSHAKYLFSGSTLHDGAMSIYHNARTSLTSILELTYEGLSFVKKCLYFHFYRFCQRSAFVSLFFVTLVLFRALGGTEESEKYLDYQRIPILDIFWFAITIIFRKDCVEMAVTVM